MMSYFGSLFEDSLSVWSRLSGTVLQSEIPFSNFSFLLSFTGPSPALRSDGFPHLP